MLGLLLLGSAAAAAAAPFDHSLWNQVLSAAVNEIGEVDYAKLKADPAGLDAYVALLGRTSPANQPNQFPTRPDELAYYINAYNALTTWGVVRGYPTGSVRDLGGIVPFAFFLKKDYILGGTSMSLRSLENDIIRKKYKEPRIHFAIVCASLSCPKLSRTAYTAANLETQLEAETRRYFAETRNLAVDAAKNEIVLAAILDWYKEDFEAFTGRKGPAALVAYARRYAPPERQREMDSLKSPRVRFRGYDWSINDPGSRARAKTEEERALARPASP